MLLEDGRKLETTQNMHQRYRWPADQDKLMAKFKNNLVFSGLIDERRAERLVEAIEDFDKCVSTAGFVRQWLGKNEWRDPE